MPSIESTIGRLVPRSRVAPPQEGRATWRPFGDRVLAGAGLSLAAVLVYGITSPSLLERVPMAATFGLLLVGLAFAGWLTVRRQARPASTPAAGCDEERFRQLADAMPQIVWTTRPDGRNDYYNRRWYEFLGVPDGQATHDAWRTIIHPDDLAPCLRRWEECVRSGAAFEMEVRLADRKTGGPLWHLVRTVPARDAEGRIVRWYGTSTNIDVQKRAIDELRGARLGLEDRVAERTAELTAANETLRQEVAQRQRAERRLELQYGAAQVLARSASLPEAIGEILKAVREAIGWDVAEYWQHDPEAGAVRCVEASTGPTPALEEFARESRPLAFASEVGLAYRVWEARKAMWVESLAAARGLARAEKAMAAGLTSNLGFPVSSGDSVVGVLVFFGDRIPEPDADTIALLTGIAGQIGLFLDRQRAKAALTEATDRLQAVLDAATEMAIVATTPEGTITVFNVGAERMLGYSAAEVVGRLTPAVFHCPDEVRRRAAEASLERGVPVGGLEMITSPARRGHPEQQEWIHIRKDGSRLTVALVVTAQRNSKGEVVGFVGMVKDISERKRVDQALASAKEAAEAANRAKGDFLAIMSHEIRTPLNGILGMAQLVLDTELTSTQREYLASLHLSAESLRGLVNDILDFSKIEAGKLDLDPEPFDLQAGLAATLRPLALEAGRRGLEVVCRVAPAVPVALVGDFGRLRQILLNLLGNAIKFTKRGRVALDVGLERMSAGEVVLRFAIADTGIGIAADKLETIFAPFEQADGSTTRKYGGTGLGLAISARLARLLGGSIGVESEPGVGSTFSFTALLALQAPPPSGAAADRLLAGHAPPNGVAADHRPAATPEPGAAPAGLRILLAEDNKVNQVVITHTLRKEGHRVVVAENGREALDAVAREAFDLVLMDVAMPEMDGLEATRLIRERERGTGRRLPVIALTANVMRGDREICVAAGMDAHVGKPFQIAELRAAIRGATAQSPPPPEPTPDALPVLDEAGLLARLAGNRTLLKTLAQLFRTEGPRQLEAVRVAVASGDPVAVQRAAHTIKGAVALLASPKAAEAARILEAMGKGGDLAGGGAAFARLEEAVSALGTALDSLEKT